MNTLCHRCAEMTLICSGARPQPSANNLQLLADRFRRVEDVVSVTTKADEHGRQTIVIHFNESIPREQMLRRMAQALRSSTERTRPAPFVPQEAEAVQQDSRGAEHRFQAVDRSRIIDVQFDQDRPRQSAQNRLRQGLRRFVYGALAIGSFGMAWVGLLVPGIPTVPFVILTAALASQADPILHDRLMRSKIFGQMMRDWESHHAVRPGVRMQAAVATVIIVCITLVVTPSSPTIYTIIGVMFVFSMYIIWRLPVLREEEFAQPEMTTPQSIPFATVA